MNESAGFDVSLSTLVDCVCVCVSGRGVILQFPPRCSTGLQSSRSEAFKAQRGRYIYFFLKKRRSFPSVLTQFPEIRKSNKITQFRDVMPVCEARTMDLHHKETGGGKYFCEKGVDKTQLDYD